MISRCAGDNCVRDLHVIERACSFRVAISGVSAESGMQAALSSSNWSADRCRNTLSALLRTIAKSHVDTSERPLNSSALRHTSKNTSCTRSSAAALLRMKRKAKRKTRTFVPLVQQLHRKLVACCNAPDQIGVKRLLRLVRGPIACKARRDLSRHACDVRIHGWAPLFRYPSLPRRLRQSFAIAPLYVGRERYTKV
jgi:hypothetical protein